MFSLTQRIDQAELMDDSSIGFEEFQKTLAEIETLNRLMGAYRPTLKALAHFAQKKRGKQEPFRILDIGFGNGDLLRSIALWAKKNGILVELAGVDLNPWSARAATLLTPPSFGIHYHTSNIFHFTPQRPYHVMVNSLFTHHLTDADVVRILTWMTRRALSGWVINDLHRHPIPYHFIHSFVRLCGFNRLVRNDAPLSVARAFTRQDWEGLIKAADVSADHVRISWHWPFRFGVVYDR